MFAERLETLRARNKSLMNQLRLQRETLERLSGFKESRKREREDEAPEEEERRRPEEERRRRPEEEERRRPEEEERRRPEEERRRRPEEERRPPEEEERRRTEEERRPPEEEERRRTEELVTVIRGNRGPARAALAKPSVRFADVYDIYKDQADVQQSTSVPPGLGGPVDTKSCWVTHSKPRSGVQSRVRFQSDECDDVPVPDRRHSQPLLGYDWIAGVLETDDSLMERSDDFFDDLRLFRSLNRDECVPTAHSHSPEDVLSASPPLGDKDAPQANAGAHQCTFSYRINSRLFPVPLRAQEVCPVCKKHKSSHPHTMSEPALIRVSVPRGALLPPYKHKAHRRCSFDPSDSLGLPSHCLSGWSNTGQNTLPPPSSLDLQSSFNTKASGSVKELENLCEPKMSGNRDPVAPVSRLARHNFIHSPAKRKPSSTSNRVC